MVFNRFGWFHELLPKLIALVKFHQFAHSLFDFFWRGSLDANVGDVLVLLTVLVGYDFHDVIEVFWQWDICMGDLRDEIIKIVNNLIFHALKVLQLFVYVVKPICPVLFIVYHKRRLLLFHCCNCLLLLFQHGFVEVLL